MLIILLLNIALANPREEYLEYERNKNSFLIQNLEDLRESTEFHKDPIERNEEVKNEEVSSEINPPVDQMFAPPQEFSLTKEEAMQKARELSRKYQRK